MSEKSGLTIRVKSYPASRDYHGYFICLEGFFTQEEAEIEGSKAVRALAVALDRPIYRDETPPNG